MPRICVLGAGIMGITSAYVIAEKYPGCHITVVATSFDSFTESCCSDHGFGITGVYRVSPNDHPDVIKWVQETAAYCRQNLANEPERARDIGIAEVKGLSLLDKKDTGNLRFHETVNNFKLATSEEIRELSLTDASIKTMFSRENISVGDIIAYTYSTYVINTTRYMRWMKLKLEELAQKKHIRGLAFIKRNVRHLTELYREDFDLIVNCSGMGARELADDENVFPMRGQYFMVRCPQIKTMYDARMAFTTVCPKGDLVCLGCADQVGRSDTQLDIDDSDEILRRCKALCPVLKEATIEAEWVGVRPCRRGGPRVEIERCHRKIVGSNPTPIIHCYGHGGKGTMQHWGCVQEVLKLASHELGLRSNL